MSLALLGILLPAAAAWPLVRLLPIVGERRHGAAAISFGAGVGLSSIIATWLTAAGLDMVVELARADLVIWAGLGLAAWWLCWRRLATLRGPASTRLSSIDRLARAGFASIAIVTVATVAADYIAAPDGDWDAWTIWNHRARALFRSGTEWTTAFIDDASAHPDYPLLVPVSVARLWAYAGHEATSAPALVGVLFGTSIVAVVLLFLDTRRRAAWIAGAVLIAAGNFIDQISAQCADVPLAFFMVASLGLLCMAASVPDPGRASHGVWLASGLLGGLAAWTKNEGVPFVLFAGGLAAMLAARQRRASSFLWWLAGAAPPLVTTVWFKLTIAAATDLIARQTSAAIVARILSPERHLTVVALMAQRIGTWGGPLTPGMLVLVGGGATVMAMARRAHVSGSILAVVWLMLATYYAVYVMTPQDVAWHVSTSADRLLVQLWPSVVVAAFWGLRETESTR